MGTGAKLSDLSNPRVMVKVGNDGDVGTMEIVEMLFVCPTASWGHKPPLCPKPRRICADTETCRQSRAQLRGQFLWSKSKPCKSLREFLPIHTLWQSFITSRRTTRIAAYTELLGGMSRHQVRVPLLCGTRISGSAERSGPISISPSAQRNPSKTTALRPPCFSMSNPRHPGISKTCGSGPPTSKFPTSYLSSSKRPVDRPGALLTHHSDNDMNITGQDRKTSTPSQISVFTGRGTLIESQGPCWFYGSGSEHSALYRYQLYKAKNIYIGHLQSESPYYQPSPAAPRPFGKQLSFPGDPKFKCKDGKDSCKSSWALRVIDSSNIYMHGLGMYSFFVGYNQEKCIHSYSCQERLLEVKGVTDTVFFNIFTIGASV